MSFNKWENISIGDVCQTISETHKTKKGELIFLNTGDIERGKILHNKYSSVEKMPGQAKKSIKKGDILFSEIRPANGRWAYVDFEANDFILSTKLMVIRANDKVNSRYLYHLLTSPEIVKLLQQLAETRSGTFPQITFTQVANIQIKLPTIPAQNKIASFFDALDRKIELNRLTNQTLENIAQTLFREMCLPKSEELPDGWRMGNFEEVAKQVKESVKPSLHPNKLFHHYSLPAFDINEMPSLDFSETILSNKTIVKKYSVLFSKLNPRIPRIWSIGNIDESISICSTEFIGFVPKQNFYYSFINYFLKQTDTVNKLIGFATGTSSSHQRVKPDGILNLAVVIPSDDILKKYNDLVSPFLEQRFKNIIEIETLKQVRDNLLPKLMKGEIEINNI